MEEQCTSRSSPQRGGGRAEVHGRLRVIRCGWLRKQGGFVKTWHSRWFVLRGDQLYYYKDEEETKPLVRQKSRQCKRIRGDNGTTSSRYNVESVKPNLLNTNG